MSENSTMPGGKVAGRGGGPTRSRLPLSSPLSRCFQRFGVSDLVWVAVAASLVADSVRQADVVAVCV